MTIARIDGLARRHDSDLSAAPTGRICRALLLAAAALSLGAPAAAAAAPHLNHVRCFSSCVNTHTVAPGGRLEIVGTGLGNGMRAVFPIKTTTGAVAARSIKTRLTHHRTLIARVPKDARSGRLFVQVPGGPHSNSADVRIAGSSASGTPPPPPTAFNGDGMWIWYISRSRGGSIPAIISKARAHHMRTLYVKSGDGSSYWSQFSPSLVAALKAGGLRVCGWQYVYGDHPKSEASVAARAIRNGAECFVIDAEAHYEGKYSQARTYVKRLRAKAGSAYPIGLAGFPYTDYHPSFPYSIFLGPGGAQFNLPQAYWKTIGGSVDTILGHTYLWNRPYNRPIYPLGQVYQNPKRSEIFRFRKYVRAEGSRGLSWWDWQEASSSAWRAVGDPLGPFHAKVDREYAALSKGSSGDLVLWAQQHLRAAGQKPSLSGRFRNGTVRAVRGFQASNGLPVTGVIDTATWIALLRYPASRAAASRSQAASAGRRNGPPTAWLPAKRYEIPPPSKRGP